MYLVGFGVYAATLRAIGTRMPPCAAGVSQAGPTACPVTSEAYARAQTRRRWPMASHSRQKLKFTPSPGDA